MCRITTIKLRNATLLHRGLLRSVCESSCVVNSHLLEAFNSHPLEALYTIPTASLSPPPAAATPLLPLRCLDVGPHVRHCKTPRRHFPASFSPSLFLLLPSPHVWVSRVVGHRILCGGELPVHHNDGKPI